jgi:hypothetical protein
VNYCWNISPRIRCEERNVGKNVVMHKMEYDDMASEQSSEKAGTSGRKPPPDRRPSQPQQPQIPSPLSSDGPELVRDSHC